MIEKLFSYGTLQLESVQLNNFGRKLPAQSDELLGYEIRDCLIKDPKVVTTSGKAVHPIACFTGNLTHTVRGKIFDLTPEELIKADSYEVDDYKRIPCILKSGEQAWVYVQSGLNIDINYFKKGDVKLELLHEHHIPDLCEKAKDTRIWEYHRTALNASNICKLLAIDKAHQDIIKKSRYMFVIYYRNEIIGSTSYYDVNLSHLRMYIGYSWLHPNYWGKGINTTVKKLMLAYAFEKLKFNRIAFCIDSENTRSRAAIEKLNIPFEGILKKHQLRSDGSHRDSAIYAITDEIWKSNLV